MNRRTNMKSSTRNSALSRLLWAGSLITLLCLLALVAAGQTVAKKAAAKARTFATPQQAADALIDAAEKYDVAALEAILGPDGHDIISTGEAARDREQATAFAALAREQKNVVVNRRLPNRAFLNVGKDNWPFPVPIVRQAGHWSFDSKAGRQEVLYRRVGRNELDVIEICRGYVEAQHEYALKKREGYGVNEYAQRIIATPGKQDGLAWQNADGTWDGPVGENAARAIQQGYTNTGQPQPFHGYMFKVLKGQGPAAPMGRMDFVVKGVMIGGFALVAAPAQYGVTGVKTFMVSHDGVVYEKDFGPNTATAFKQMELFNPDKTWSPVKEP
ncbi:MAG TPA: DUF2950 domain-containing protein [Blastocatellia bacterium]|nr:DUF2950 domain-containing protein [Blastocatellia bacterium]